MSGWSGWIEVERVEIPGALALKGVVKGLATMLFHLSRVSLVMSGATLAKTKIMGQIGKSRALLSYFPEVAPFDLSCSIMG